MPTYQVYATPGTLNARQKDKVAEAITIAHTKATGAPRYYVQVIIDEVPDRRRYVAGKYFDQPLWIMGNIRAGRTPEQCGAMALDIAERVAEAAGMDKEFVWVDFNHIKASDIMRYMNIIPEPGEEKKWFEALPDHVRAQIDANHAGHD